MGDLDRLLAFVNDLLVSPRPGPNLEVLTKRHIIEDRNERNARVWWSYYSLYNAHVGADLPAIRRSLKYRDKGWSDESVWRDKRNGPFSYGYSRFCVCPSSLP